MKIWVAAIMIFVITGTIFGQGDVTKANECYDKKDWGCAVDYYTRAVINKGFKPEETHIIEFRIGFGLEKLNQTGEAIRHYLLSISAKSDYLYPWWNGGNILYGNARYDSAVIFYKKAVQYAVKPEDKDLLNYYLGETYFNQKLYALSASTFRNVADRKDSYLNTDAYIAESYLKQAKYDSGLLHIRNAYNYLPPTHNKYKALLLVHGQLLRNKQRYDSATVMFQKALAIDPAYGSASWEMGLVFANQKKYAEAAVWYNKTLPAYKNDTANTYILLNNLRSCYNSLGDYAAAAATLQKLIPYAKTPYEDYKRLAGVQFGKLKKYTEAEANCRQLILLAKNRFDSAIYKDQRSYMHALLGRMMLMKKDTIGAIPQLKEALRLSLGQVEANLAMGDILWARDNRVEAIKYYTAPVNPTRDTLATTDADYARFYGRRAMGRYNKNSNDLIAVKLDVEDALRYDSLQKEAIQMWPVALIRDYSLSTKRDRCLALLDRGIAAYARDKPYVSELYNSKAVLYDGKGDTTQVLQSLKKAIEVNEDNISAWDNLLKYYNGHSRFEEGIAAANKLIARLKTKKENQTVAVAMLYKGDFLWKQDKKDAAKAVYAEALVYDPNNKDVQSRSKMQ